MTVVCSWCRHEGQAGIVGEKAPFEDRRETHGICLAHRIQVGASWGDLSRSAQPDDARQAFVESDSLSLSEVVGGSVVRSASHLWVSLRTFSRKVGL